MASHLDLEEQEQLDQIKSFWARWGNLITGLVTLALVCFAAWNGWNYWQQRQATQAAVLFDTFEEASKQGDLALLTRSLSDLQDQFPRTTLTALSGLSNMLLTKLMSLWLACVCQPWPLSAKTWPKPAVWWMGKLLPPDFNHSLTTAWAILR